MAITLVFRVQSNISNFLSKFQSQTTDIQLIILIGQYAQNYYLKDNTKESLTETVKNFSTYLPTYFTLPHPSPRNNIWMAKNKWFENKVLPNLKKTVTGILNQK